MKYTEFSESGHCIEFWNSYTGRESILVDGRKVSSLFSVSGSTHRFNLDHKSYLLQTEYRLFERPSLKLTLFAENALPRTLYAKTPIRIRVLTAIMLIPVVFLVAMGIQRLLAFFT